MPGLERLKACTKCGQGKAVSSFRPGRSTCWDCIRKYGSAWFRANRDRINEKRRRHYREHRVEICARWRKMHGLGRPSAPYSTRLSLERRG